VYLLPTPPCSYLTPAGSQGLAPHHDDVELWVVQTSGKKRWRLYEPLNGFQLPNAGSGDLEQSALGPPVMEVELNVGDCLYMPRGTVHQAEAVEVDSSHLTISTYQRCSYGDLATHVLQVGGWAGAWQVCHSSLQLWVCCSLHVVRDYQKMCLIATMTLTRCFL
jgi:hypothetical protein